jgi:Sigma-70 region 2
MRAKVNIHAAFDDYHRAFFDFVYRLTRRADVAEDITQECFLALMYGPETRRGATVWFCYPGQGRYILSLVPHEGFILGSKGAWNLYVLHTTHRTRRRKTGKCDSQRIV